MESQQISMLSSLRGELKTEDYIQPHYKESYRLAIDHLVGDGRESYQEFLKGERVGSFLSEDELLFITTHAEQPPPGNHTEEINGPSDSKSSSGTYWPVHSDVETPDLDLGWPEVLHDRLQTNIDLLFHPPRQNNPTIKEVIRKHIQDARQVIAIVMDMFTDVDIFKETVDASIRGVPVYILLDDFHLKSFLAMAENQDIKIQQLRNMRVRTVKGQDYLCRSGAKFHGAMEQKFLLVDCQTAVYGSYSFTWSFEKINLSMVQVITGHLVESYDEEFRTLYARSTVPAELCPPEGLFQRNTPNGKQILPKYVSHSAQKFERKDQLRHTLDTVYRKTCERQIGMRELEERLYEEEPIEPRPLIDNGMGVQHQMPQLLCTEANFLKRHSYAGERQDVYVPENARHRASNWNISKDTGFPNGRNNYPMVLDNYSQGPQIYRGQNMRHTYHSSDKPVLSKQQNMPTLDSASKSFMRTWRIESYLKNPDAPYEDSCDYLDQYEPPDNKASPFMHARMRSSLVFRSTIPEQLETNSYTNNSSTGACQTDPSAAPNTASHYSSMQWNPTAGAENRINNEEFMFKRQSLQILDDARNNISYGPGRNSHHSVYASLGRAKGGMMIKKPDIQTDNWYKRHSVADPRSNTEYDHESSSHMYGGAFAKRPINRSTAGVNAQNGGYGSNLNEDQRSVSHFDVKSIVDTKSPPTSMWQEPPSRTVSAAALDGNTKELTVKSTGMGSPHFLKKSSKKIRSLLNIPEKKEVSPRTMETASLTSGGSSDTITAEDEEKKSDGEMNLRQSTTNSVRSSEHRRNQSVDDHLKSSTPRFRTEEHHRLNSPSKSMMEKKHNLGDKNVRPSLETGNWRTDRSADSRLYSRFEPFCAFENKHSSHLATRSVNTQSQEKVKSMLLSKGDTTNEHNLGRAARGHHENKLGKFIQRVGNFIHKNK
ncbi:protein FAM83B [Centroberyx affinis]|uniref:protein FAM83B n=1 Tax=Centroberyx affinis TaxID=166261 RepID=UPI003A5BB2C3